MFLGLIVLSVIALGLPTAGTAWGQQPTVDTEVLWTSYVGGSAGQGETVHDMALDGAGNTYIVGTTESTDMPGLKNPTDYTGWKAFVAKVDPSGVVQWTSYVSSDANSEAYGVAVVRGSGSIYIAGKADRGKAALPQAFLPQRHRSGSRYVHCLRQR